jgi:hypothetical protein
MPTRYTAEYRHSKQGHFQCTVELDSEGWSAHIFDCTKTDRRTKEPEMIYERFVDGPDAGKATLQTTMAQILRSNGLPEKALVWKESS